MIIADYLYDNGIPFRSDAALKLPRSQKVVYPDFTILRISDGALIFLEHFGMMDEPEYLDGFFEKKLLYNNEGLYEGKNLIFTFEDRLHPLNIRQIEGSIRAILTA